MMSLRERDRLLAILQSCGRVAVAFSGGVDSAVVAKAAQIACGTQAVAVTAVSASLASGEREAAEKLAALIGIRHRVIETREFDDPDYLKNAPDRCYFCKTELYTQLERLLCPSGSGMPPVWGWNLTCSSTEPTSTTGEITVRGCRPLASTRSAAR